MAGWVVGKSDFNENPVVSPDLEFVKNRIAKDTENGEYNKARKFDKIV